MNSILEAFVDRSRATILFLIVIVIAGYIAYSSIPRESTPDVRIPIIYVVMKLEGISPEDAQRLLLRPMENALKTIDGIKEMTSFANEGSANILMEFDAGFDSEKALSDVRNKVQDNEFELPQEAEKPTIHEINLSLFPVLNIMLTGDIPNRTLIKIARDLKNKVESAPGVLEVKIVGEKEDSLEIVVEPKLVENYGLSVQAVRQIIDSNNKLVAAGSLRGDSGEFAIKVPSLIYDLETLLNFPIKVSQNSTLRVGDVATVKRTFKDPLNIAKVNGKQSVVLEVSKKTGENIITTVAGVKELVEKERRYWPQKLGVVYGQDKSTDIIDMVSDLENNIILGIIFVMIVVILSVGPRSAFLISLSIPTSFLAGVLLLSVMDLTLNIVVLFSLILTVGMIVDDAIVVSEYADRLMINGRPSSRAFVESAKRMVWPIVTSTLVKIVVFLPLLFWPGIVGQFMVYMPITVIAVLTNSLIFALFFQPAIGPLIGGKVDNESQEQINTFRASESGSLDLVTGYTRWYLDVLNSVLNHPKKFVLTIITVLIGVYVYFFNFGTGVEFFPRIEPESIRMTVIAPGNLSLNEREKILTDIERKLDVVSDEIQVVYSKAGNFNDSQIPEDTIGTIFVEYLNWKDRRKSLKIIEDIKANLKDLRGVRVEFAENKEGPPPEKPVQLNITSRFYEKVPQIADTIKAGMRKIGGFENIEDSRPSRSIEWQLEVDREKAAEYGIDINTIGNTVRMVTNGMKISTYRPDDVDEEVDILLKFPNEYKNIKTLDNVKIVSTTGALIPISNFVKKVPKSSIGKIKRVNRERVISLKADVNKNFLVDSKVTELKSFVEDAKFDSDVNIVFKGEDEDQQEAASFLQGAFFLALILMFGVMLIQFNNYYHTIIVMSAVFLSTVGVIIGLIVTNQPFGIVMCGIGVIALGGIVLNNNILFVDTYQHLRRDGMEVREAILRAGIQRLRPILLTAITAILGLLPMVLGLTFNFMDREITYDAPSSQWWRQLSASIAGGLSFATILTLFFTPCLLLIGKRFDRYKNEQN